MKYIIALLVLMLFPLAVLHAQVQVGVQGAPPMGAGAGSFEQTAAGLPGEFGSLEQLRDKLKEELKKELDTLITRQIALLDSAREAKRDSLEEDTFDADSARKAINALPLKEQVQASKDLAADGEFSAEDGEALARKAERVDELYSAWEEAEERIAQGQKLEDIKGLAEKVGNGDVQKALNTAGDVQSALDDPNGLTDVADEWLGQKGKKMGKVAYVNPANHPFVKGKTDLPVNNQGISRPITDRLTFGGSFHLNREEPVSLDLAPQIGYKFSDRWTAGLGCSFRYLLGRTSAAPTYSANTWGLRAFSRYMLFSSFFANTEVEAIHHAIVAPDGSRDIRWTPGVLIGIGGRYSISKGLKGNATFNYNLIWDENDQLYNSPWMLKIGVDI